MTPITIAAGMYLRLFVTAWVGIAFVGAKVGGDVGGMVGGRVGIEVGAKVMIGMPIFITLLTTARLTKVPLFIKSLSN